MILMLLSKFHAGARKSLSDFWRYLDTRTANKTRFNPIRAGLFESVYGGGVFPPALVQFDPDNLGQ